MTLYALCSPGGSPGVTTSALALTLAWAPPVLLAECDPAGGAILAGLFAGHLTAPRGLLGAAFDAGLGATALSAGPGGQLAVLDASGSRTFLAGLSDPRQAPGLAPAWPAVARVLAAQHADVIADCGRLDAADTQPIAVLSEAELAILVLRPTLRQVAGARSRIEMLAQVRGGTDRVRLLLVGDKGHRPAEIAKALGVAVAATLPSDPRTAAVLSDGVGRRASLTDRPLMRAAKAAVKAVLTVTAASPRAGSPMPGPSRHAGTRSSGGIAPPSAGGLPDAGRLPDAGGLPASEGTTIAEGLTISDPWTGNGAGRRLGEVGTVYRADGYGSASGYSRSNGHGGGNGSGANGHRS
jgi:hypothetical protein